MTVDDVRLADRLRTFSATVSVPSPFSTERNKTTNSSPPMRAAVSDRGWRPRCARAMAASNWSPTAVAEAIVDRLEAVEVEEEQGQVVPVALRARPSLAADGRKTARDWPARSASRTAPLADVLLGEL